MLKIIEKLIKKREVNGKTVYRFDSMRIRQDKNRRVSIEFWLGDACVYTESVGDVNFKAGDTIDMTGFFGEVEASHE